MALKDRLVEIVYRLKDDFSAKVSSVTGSFKKIDAGAEKTNAGLGGLSAGFTRLGKSARVASIAIKATIIGAIVSFVASIASAVSSLGSFRNELDATAKAARSIGESVENMTALQYAAELSGLAVEKLRLGMQYMTRVTSEAAKNTGGAVKAFEELGLSAEVVNQANPAEKLNLIAEALQDIDNQADRVRLAVMLFGSENARGFISLMEDGAQGIERMTAAAREFGLTVNDEQAAKVEDYNDNLATMKARFAALNRELKLGILERANRAMELAGFGKQVLDPLEAVNIKIAEIHQRQYQLHKESKNWWKALGGTINKQMREVDSELEQLIATRDELLSDQRLQQAQSKQRAAEREHNRKLSAIRAEGTESLKKTLAERRKEYQKNLADLARLKNEEKQIADEFAAFVGEVQSANDEAGAPDLIDTSKAKFDAEVALNQGDFDTAIEKARQAADMVREMKEAGAESNIVLTGLAKMIETVANAAAKGKTKAKEGLIAEQKAQIDEVAKALANLPKAKIAIDEDALRAELDRLQKVLDARPLVVKTRTESVAGWGSQTDIEQQIGEAARQQGGL